MRAAALKHVWVELDGQRVTRVKDLPKKYHQFVDRHVDRVSALQRARERWAPRNGGIQQLLPIPSAFTGTVMIYTTVGTATNTVPFDAAHLTMEAWGGGGGGGGSNSVSGVGVGGAGAGGYTITSNFLIAGNGGLTFQVVVGGTGTGGAAGNPAKSGSAGGASTVTAISVTGWNTVTCNGGSGENNDTAPGSAGGTVTNTNAGSTNTTGATGGSASGNTHGTGAAGHAGGIGGDGGPYGAGGNGADAHGGGSSGSPGAVVFSYAP